MTITIVQRCCHADITFCFKCWVRFLVRTKKTQNSIIRLILTFWNFVANLPNLTYGLSIGWLIIYSDRFKTVDNPLDVAPLSADAIKWIECSFYAGTLIGIICLTLAGDIFGRKYTLLTLLMPQGVILLYKIPFIHTHNRILIVVKLSVCVAIENVLNQWNWSVFPAGGSVNLVVLFVSELADDKYTKHIIIDANLIRFSKFFYKIFKKDSRSSRRIIANFDKHWRFIDACSWFIFVLFGTRLHSHCDFIDIFMHISHFPWYSRSTI